MIKSMTGFGCGEYSDEHCRFAVEIKSVNHRYLDMSIKLPRKFNVFESAVRSVIKENTDRGKLDVYIAYENLRQNDVALRYNRLLAESYLSHLRDMSAEFGLEDDVRVSTLSRFPEVFSMEEAHEDIEELWPFLEKALRMACARFLQSRKAEGEHLKEDLNTKLDQMTGYVAEIEKRAPEVLKEYHDRLLEKVKELLEDRQIDEDRIIQEVTIFADKICVDEETVRLRSHIMAMREALSSEKSVGRRLDFLAQEMNREANTIVSKSNDLRTSDAGISLKTSIEKVREQIQNIE